MATDNLLKKKEYSWGMQLLIFTVLFLITAAGAYLFFGVEGRTFLTAAKDGNKDGVAQIYPTYVAVKHLVEGIFAGQGLSGWNWSIGLGAENWNMFASKLANPFTYVIIAFPERLIDVGYTVAAVLRQYCTGLAFMFFGRGVGLNQNQRLVGALCYSFSMWVFLTSIAQSGFDNAAILFPLLVLGTEKILKKESPVLFVLSVFFLLSSGVIWAYASGIMIIVYYFVRTLCNGDFRKGTEYAKTTGYFILCGIVGIAIGAAFVSSILMSMTGATTDTGNGKEVLFSIREYLSYPTALFRAVATGAESYSAIGLPIIGVVLIPLIFPEIKKKKAEAIMAAACLIGTFIPFVCRIFNGFSYASGRWFYMVAFFMTWATMSVMNAETFRSIRKCVIMEIFLVLMSGWCMAKFLFLDLADNKTAFTAGMGLVFGTAVIVIAHIEAMNYEASFFKLIKRFAPILLIGIIMLDIMEITNIQTYVRGHAFVKEHSVIGDAYDGIMNTGESAVAEIQKEDNSFYRSDQVDGYYGIRTSGARVNENVFFGNRSVYTCFSSAPSAWHEYNMAVGNCAGNYRRTLICSNDNRAMLDYLMGVKYFVGSPVDAEEPTAASEYVPYGYEQIDNVNGFEVFRNTHCMGLGTVYSQYITESEFAEYPIVVREQVLMQAAVVPDDQAGELAGMKHADRNDIRVTANEIEYTTKCEPGVELRDKQLIVTDDDAYLYLKIPTVENCQLIVAFEGFERQGLTYEDRGLLLHGSVPEKSEQSFADRIYRASYKDDQGFKINLAKGDRKKAAKCEEGGVRSFNDIDTYDVNLGYFKKTKGKISVRVGEIGRYDFDAIKVYAIPMTDYDANAEKLDESSYKIDTFEDDYISGTVDVKDDVGILYLSILDDPGWHIYVDGEKVSRINSVNISFMGAAIPEGTHTVELKYAYPHKTVIMLVTAAGVIVLVILAVQNRRRKKNETSC